MNFKTETQLRQELTEAFAMARAERAGSEALRKALAQSCADERQQAWEAGPGGGCSRALTAEAKTETLSKDAARYRWLRDTTNWASNSSGERIDVRNSPELWDAAIDEAIARAALLPDNAPLIGGDSPPNRADGYRVGNNLGEQ